MSEALLVVTAFVKLNIFYIFLIFKKKKKKNPNRCYIKYKDMLHCKNLSIIIRLHQAAQVASNTDSVCFDQGSSFQVPYISL